MMKVMNVSELVPVEGDFSVEKFRSLLSSMGYSEQLLLNQVFDPDRTRRLFAEVVGREPRWGAAVAVVAAELGISDSSGVLVPASASFRVPDRLHEAPPRPPAVLDEISAAGYDLVVEGVAENTRKAYRAQLAIVDDYLRSRSLPLLDQAPVNPAVLIDWMAFQFRHPLEATGEPMAPSSVALTLSAVRYHSRAMQDRDATWVVPQALALTKAYVGYCRSWFKAGYRVKQVAATSFEELRVYAEGMDRETIRGRRNIAIVLLGFWMAGRQSELSALWMSDDDRNLRVDRRGMQIYLPFSKTDQSARGQWVTVPRFDEEPQLCAVRAVEHWRDDLREAGHVKGPLFVAMPHGRAPNMFAEPFVGLDPPGIGDVTIYWSRKLGIGRRTAHSHRRGAATEAARLGASLKQIMKMGRWTKADTVMRYIDEASYEHPLLGR